MRIVSRKDVFFCETLRKCLDLCHCEWDIMKNMFTGIGHCFERCLLTKMFHLHLEERAVQAPKSLTLEPQETTAPPDISCQPERPC
jgi:hypothetical protein